MLVICTVLYLLIEEVHIEENEPINSCTLVRAFQISAYSQNHSHIIGSKVL